MATQSAEHSGQAAFCASQSSGVQTELAQSSYKDCELGNVLTMRVSQASCHRLAYGKRCQSDRGRAEGTLGR